MVFDYSSMGDARASDELQASFKQRPGPSPEQPDEGRKAAAHPAQRQQSHDTHALRQMYNQTAISFEGMEYVKKLGDGTFGAVDKRRVVQDNGKSFYVAVKRLKAPNAALREVAAHCAGEGAPLSDALKRMCGNTDGAQDGKRTSIAGRPSDAEMDKINTIMSALSKDDQMFLAEVDIMRRVSHPNIVHYLGCGVIEEKGEPYIAIAQECCEGGSLRRLVDKAAASPMGKRLYSYGDALRWTTQIAHALAELHNADPQIIHRDLKTENIMLDEAGRAGDVRVMDFGLAKLRTVARHGYRSAEQNRTSYVMTGGTGSYLYMAPEVKSDKPYSEKVDIFSLAIIMLYRFELFKMTLMASIVQKNGETDEFETYARGVVNGHREPLPDHWPQALKVQDVIQRCWQSDGAQRPTARELVKQLEALKGDVEQMDVDSARGVISAKRQASAHDAKQSCCTIS